MNPLLSEFVGAVLRWMLATAGTALVTRNVITAEQSDRFVSALTGHLLYLLPIAASLVWSLVHKYWSDLKLRAARDLPAGASDDDIADRARALFLGL